MRLKPFMMSSFLFLCACTTSIASTSVLDIPLQTEHMSFFITSVGLGKGGDLGGISGADAHCQKLAEAAGATGKTWKAYLSTAQENARDRIGKGPWHNARAVLVAKDLDTLHNDEKNNIRKITALDESGNLVSGRGDENNVHDMLTGSDSQGRYLKDKTCQDWTSSDAGVAMVGHHDRLGLGLGPSTQSWNSSHDSLGCSPQDLKTTGGGALFYCFAKVVN